MGIQAGARLALQSLQVDDVVDAERFVGLV
jgi:hypothetical protein